MVERTFAWLCNCRRLVRCYKRRDNVTLTFMTLASVRLLADLVGHSSNDIH